MCGLLEHYFRRELDYRSLNLQRELSLLAKRRFLTVLTTTGDLNIDAFTPRCKNVAKPEQRFFDPLRRPRNQDHFLDELLVWFFLILFLLFT